MFTDNHHAPLNVLSLRVAATDTLRLSEEPRICQVATSEGKSENAVTRSSRPLLYDVEPSVDRRGNRTYNVTR